MAAGTAAAEAEQLKAVREVCENPGVIPWLMGGLGNQMFIVAAG